MNKKRKTKKPVPTIRKGDVFVIYGYDSVLHADKFTTRGARKMINHFNSTQGK